MAQNVKTNLNYIRSDKKGSTGTRTANNRYVQGSVAYDYNLNRKYVEEPRRQLSNTARKNRDKANHMNLAYVTFLVAALCACAYILINYIQLNAELTNKTKSIARLETQLNELRVSNDEEYSRIMSDIDLERIKQIAIGELGMVYATDGQIITYENVDNDYMRQVVNN